MSSIRAPRWHTVLLPLSVILLGFAALTTPLPGKDQPIRLNTNLRIPIPPNLKTLHIANPYAKFLVEVDYTGAVIDAMAIEASHHDLLAPGLKAIHEAPFIPAQRDGRPARSQAAVYVNFFDLEQDAWREGSGILPFGGSVSDAIESRFYKNTANRFAYGLSRSEELDAPLRIRQTRARVYTSEKGVRQKGGCVVEYFVGPAGKVHFPRILRSDHYDISMSAILTLEVTIFEPPLRNGKPTCVRIRQPFNFN